MNKILNKMTIYEILISTYSTDKKDESLSIFSEYRKQYYKTNKTRKNLCVRNKQ